MALILTIAVLAAVISGCKKSGSDDTGNGFVPPEFVYVPEYISLSDTISDIANLCVVGDRLFFSSQTYDEVNYTMTMKLYSMSIDGTDLRELENYSIGSLPEGAMGNLYIQSMISDGDGNLWVVESGNYYGFDLPEDFDEETDEMWMYYVDMGNINTARKLDTTGRELLSIDTSALAAGMDYFYVRSINIDSNDNIYVSADTTVFVLDSTGRYLFKLEVTNWIDQLFRLSDGTVAVFGYMEAGRVLRRINFETRDWGDDVELPYNAYYFYPGGGDYTYLYGDNTSLYGIEEETEERIMLLNWINSGVSSDGLNNITILPDGRVLATSYSWNNADGRPSYEIIILTRVPYDSIPERTVLTLAAMWLDWNLRNAIISFNKTNTRYRIHVTDYSEFNNEDDWQAGMTRLSTEMISGNVPDILFTSNLPFNQYVGRGLLEDLYPYIDADAEFGRSDFIESAFRAIENDGKLYQVFANFNIQSIIGSPSVLGPEPGWNMDELIAVLNAHPEATSPMGQGQTRTSFLQFLLMMGMDGYVDWATGRCFFDGGEFAKLLEFANTFPEEYNWENEEWVSEDVLIASGQQIMKISYLGDFLNHLREEYVFGGEVVYKGFPTAGRNGNIVSTSAGVAMTTSCSEKEGAWEFIRTILTEDWQRTNMRWNYPTNKVVFNEMLEEAMTPEFYTDMDGNEVEIPKMSFYIEGGNRPRPLAGSSGGTVTYVDSVYPGDEGLIQIYALTQEQADQLMVIINSVSGTASYDETLMTIVLEGAADYFSGQSTSQDAARIIQSRASIYISEQT